MKKQIAVVLLMFAFALPAFADMGTDFRDHFNANGLASYNRDLATMIGQADFHTGKSATFPSFDVGVSVAAVNTASDNFSSDDYFYAPYVTAETKLPFFNITPALRGTTYNGFHSIGAGVKWNESIAIVNLGAAVFYDRYGTDYYDGDHFSISMYGAVPVLVFTPYVGVGYDYSGIKTKDLGVNSGKTSYDGVMRYTAGIRFQPIPFVFAYGAYTYTKYNHGFQGGVGFNF